MQVPEHLLLLHLPAGELIIQSSYRFKIGGKGTKKRWKTKNK